MKLTEHFSLEEFEYSSTALAKGIDNHIPLNGQPSNGGANECGSEILENIRSLCETILEPLRQHAGIPIQLNSGYRCPALNRAVGGSSQSQHLKGEAADIRVPDPTTGHQWFNWMERHLPFDQLIQERATRTSPTFWIHVSCCRDRPNRRQVIRQLIKNPP